MSTWVENDLQRAEGGSFLHFLRLMEAHNWHANFDPDMEAIYDSLTEQQLQEYEAMVPPGACDEPVTKICPGFYVYAHAVRAMRNGVAEVLDTLQRENLLDDTVVVVFSDHGEEFMDHLGDHRMAESDDPIVAVFESVGHGSSLYQEMINVPLLIWHPDYEGAQIDAPVSLTDIAPSVIRWMGLEQESRQWQGEYLGDVARGNQAPGRTIIGSALSDGEQQLSAVHDNKKAIWYLVSDHVDYFDLATDPGETDSIRDDKLVLAFDGMFLDYMQNVPKKAVAKSSKLTDEQIRRLQSIGYLQGVDTNAEAGEPGASQ
ncbi:MAG: sulfatase-like hydrolase/transferase [Halioglobus sp.]|nr:sulfatase-like hydrolase/transferase [Halioglobus sp.]